MSVLSAAESAPAAVGAPLHARDLTRLMLERGLWSSSGLTPQATVNARIAEDIKRRGMRSPFQRVGPSTYGLRAWVQPEPRHEAVHQEDVVESALVANRQRITRTHALSFTDAAEQVLERFGAKKPMHYRDITLRALELGLVRTQGRTPEATLNAQVGAEIDRMTKRGELPRFERFPRGWIGLSRWHGHGLAHQIEQHNAHVRTQLRERLHAMPPSGFEELIGDLLGAPGFEEVSVTGRSVDGGVNVRGTLVVGDVIRTRMAVQVKRWKQNVQAPVVQQVRGSLGTHEQGLIISTSGFSAGARDEAQRPNAVPVALMNGDQLVALLVEHNLGVRRVSHHLLELSEAEDEPE